MKIRKGDNVIVISGSQKGKSGKVLQIFPGLASLIVEGVNVRKRHERARRANQKGQVIGKTMPIHVSNVALMEGGRPVRASFRLIGGEKTRVSRKTGKEI